MRNRIQRSSRSEKITGGIFTVFGLLFWIGISLTFIYFIDQLHSVEIVGPIVLRKLLELLLLSLFGLLCFSNTVTALSTFYLSDDLELLLSLPIPRVSLYVSRLLETIAQSSWMVMAFGLPVFLAYGLSYEAGWQYYALTLCIIPAFLVIPAALGVIMADLLVSIFPARRIREALMLFGVLCLIFVFVSLRLLKPERLANAENFESVAAYAAELQSPMPVLVPPKWAAEVMQASLSGRPIPWLEFGMMMTGCVALFGVSRWLTNALYDNGRSRAQEARVARMAKAGWLDRILKIWTRPLSRSAAAIVIKDVKTFFRDPAQWSQLFLVASIVAIAIISIASLPLDAFRGPWMAAWVNSLAFLTLSLVGLMMAALAARFQFSAVSIEGRGFWLVRTGPITAEQFLWAKAWPGILPMIVVGQILAISAARLLGASNFLVWITSGTALGMALGISGIAIGMGAIYPNFKVDNAARIAASPAGMLFMVAAISMVFVVMALEILPVYYLLSAEFQDDPISTKQAAISIGCLILAAGVCLFCAIWPIRAGARRLWNMELPNG